MADEIIFQSATRLADLLAAGKLSSVELLQACLARIKAVDGRVKAFNSFDEADALGLARAADERRAAGQARGPLDGLPVGLKDVIAVEGQPLTCSSQFRFALRRHRHAETQGGGRDSLWPSQHG